MDFLVRGENDKKRAIKLDCVFELEEKTLIKMERIAKNLGMIGISQLVADAIMMFVEAHSEREEIILESLPEAS